jgi:hypothetical protein
VTASATENLAEDFADPLVGRIVAFVRAIGIPVDAARLEGETFLPGVAIAAGRLRVDAARLAWPGDLLHEAGHLAVSDPARLDEAVSDDPAEEMAAIAWSYAAALELGLAPDILFHAGGYRGGAKALIENFAQGGYVGVPMLALWGLAHEPHRARALGERGYPHMLAWKRA